MHRLGESFVQENHLHPPHQGIPGEEVGVGGVQVVVMVETVVAAAAVHVLDDASKLFRDMETIRNILHILFQLFDNKIIIVL